MDNQLLVKEENVENMIYEIRGRQVMLDSDLAKLYQCETGNLNRARLRNINRFPIDFAFQITKEEYINLKCQSGISKIDLRSINRNLPYVYTEQGVAMLASVLHTEVAEQISIKIMRAFVAMRKYISSNLLEQQHYKNMILEHDNRINLLEEFLFENKEKSNEIYFEGQIYDAYSKLIDIMSKAKKELVIIDAYADKITLDMIAKIKVKVILICRENKLLKQIDIDKYNEQYDNLTIKYSDSFYDRYLIIDEKELYHCGASLNHAGARTFSINKIEDEFMIKQLINKIN